MISQVVILTLVLGGAVFFFAGFAVTAYLMILFSRFWRHFRVSHYDRWRYIMSAGMFDFRRWRWFFSEEDNDDPNVFVFKTTAKRWLLFQISSMVACVVIIIMVLVIAAVTGGR